MKVVSCGSRSKLSLPRRLQRTLLEKVRMHFFPALLDMKILDFKLCELLVLLPPCQGLPEYMTEKKTVAFGHMTGMWLPSEQRHGTPGEVVGQRVFADPFFSWFCSIYLLDQCGEVCMNDEVIVHSF